MYGVLNFLTKDFYLLVNFAFLRVLAPSIRDTLVWAFILVTYYTIFITKRSACDYADLAIIIVVGLNRVSVIGVKYACMGREYWNSLKSKTVDKSEFGRKILILTWLFDKPKFILLCELSDELRCLGAVQNEPQALELRWLVLGKAFQTQMAKASEKYAKEAEDIGKENGLKIYLEQPENGTSFLVKNRDVWSFRSILLALIEQYSPSKPHVFTNYFAILVVLGFPAIPGIGRVVYG